MSLRTCIRKSLTQKQQEQSDREKRTLELLKREREFSNMQQTTISEMGEKQNQQIEKLQREIYTLNMQLEDSEDVVKTMRVYTLSQEEKHKTEIKRLEYKYAEKMLQQEKEFKDKESNYKILISNLEKKLNAYEIELSYIKNYKKPQNDISTQTNSHSSFSEPRTISLTDHLAMINRLKDDFYKEKFQIQEDHREVLSKMSESKKEIDVDKYNYRNEKMCERSKIIATLEQQKCDKDKKKMQELIQYYLSCLDEKSKQCTRQQDLIQKLQTIKKRQETKVQQLMKTAQLKNSPSSTSRVFNMQPNTEDILSTRKLVRQVLDQRSQVEAFILNLIQHVKNAGEDKPNAEFSSEQKEEILNLLFNNLINDSPNFDKLKSF